MQIKKQEKLASPDNSNPSRLAIVNKICQIFRAKCQRVLLIRPLQFPEDAFNVRIAKNMRYYAYPPYGIGLLSTNLKKNGYVPYILDLNMEALRFIPFFYTKIVIESQSMLSGFLLI